MNMIPGHWISFLRPKVNFNMMITVIDYKAGNIASVVYALNRLGVENRVTSNPDEIRSASKIIFPGQGAAGSAMKTLRELGLVSLLRDVKVPFLGICLGLQLLFESSEEDGTTGLALFSGQVTRLSGEGIKLPHMGWNRVEYSPQSKLFKKIPNHSFFYFAHSYAAPLSEMTCGVTRYGIPFSAAIEHENFFGVQFHPEKSGVAGLQLLGNFIEL